MPHQSTRATGLVVVAIFAILTVSVFYVLSYMYNKPSEPYRSQAMSSGGSYSYVSHQKLAKKRVLYDDSVEKIRIKFEKAKQARIEKQRIIAQRIAQQQTPSPAPIASPTPMAKTSSSSLPAILQLVRFHESRGVYTAYNPTGCEGYGCGGAYQLHVLYAATWAANAGYPGMSSNAANWPSSVQDAVALWMYNQPNGAYVYWCKWDSYC